MRTDVRSPPIAELVPPPCSDRAALEDKLQQQILASLKGIKNTTDAINSERSALVETEVAKHFEKIGVSAGLATLLRQPAALAPEALSLSNDLGSVLGQACTATPVLKAGCDNLQTFQKILHDKAAELVELQKQ